MIEDHAAEEDRERQRHDGLYCGERHKGARLLRPHDWERFDDPGLATNAYIASIRQLGDVRDRVILDAGCGSGWLSVILAKRGAQAVDGFDISPEAVAVASMCAEANGCARACRFKVGSFYAIPFPSATYDLVVGQAILHHVREKSRVAEELNRVMKPGARAVFYEPMSNSPLLERLRLLIPLRLGSDDRDEWRHKLKYADLVPFRAYFEVSWQEFELLQWIGRILPKTRRFFERLDVSLLQRLAWLRRFARGVVIELKKPADDGPFRRA